MAPLRPTIKLRADLSSDSPLSSLPPSVKAASSVSTPLSSPPPSPATGTAQASTSRAVAVRSPIHKRRAVLSSDDEGDISSLVILESSPVKHLASVPPKTGGSKAEAVELPYLSESAESAPDSDMLIMGSSQAMSSNPSAQRLAGASQTAAPTRSKTSGGMDDLDDLDDFDWDDEDTEAETSPVSSTKPPQAATPSVASTGGLNGPSTTAQTSVDRPSSPLQPRTAINGVRISTPLKLRANTTPSKPSPLPHTSAGSPAESSKKQPLPSPTSVVMARIKAKAEKEAALMSRLVATRSSETELGNGRDAKGKRRALRDDDGDEFATDVDSDDEFGRVGKRGRKQVTLSDSDDDPLPSFAAPNSTKAPTTRAVKNSGPKAVFHDPIGSRLRQKVTTSSSSTPTFVSRGQAVQGSKRSAVVDTSKAANATASSKKFMASLLQKSSKRSHMLSRVSQIRSGGLGEDLSDSDDEDADGTASGKTPANGVPHKSRPLPDATALGSSDDSESSDEDDPARPTATAVPGGLGALGSAADDIFAVLAKDRLAKEARKQARREHRRKTWGGCWVRTKKKRRAKADEPAEAVEFVKEPWDVIRIAGNSGHPLFEMLLVASDEDDAERFTSYLALGALSPAVVATVDDKAALVTALFESACLSSSNQRSALCLSHLLAILRSSTPQAPVLSEKALIQRLTGAFQGMGYRHSLIEAINRAGDGTPKKAKSRGQGDVFDLPFDQRCKAVRALSAVVEVVTSHRLMNDSRLTKMICILVLLSLDRTTPVDLKITLEKTIALAIHSISLVDYEIKLSYKLAELSKDNDMTFKLGVINALPRLGLRAGRLARSLGTFFLGGYVDENFFESPPDVSALAALVSPDEPRSAFVVSYKTDYVQMISAIRLLAVVVGDFETLFAPDIPGAASISPPALQKVTAGVKALQTNLAKVEHRIMDARASNLDRSAAKAFLLNLNVSLGYRSTMFERMHQPRRAQGEVGRKGQTTLSFAPVAK